MRTSTIAWILVILVIVFAAGAYFNLSFKSAATDTSTSTTSGVPESAPVGATGATETTPGNTSGGTSAPKPTPTETPTKPATTESSKPQTSTEDQSTQTGGATPGSTQEPLADGAEGSVVGDNVVLGTDGNEEMGAYLIAYNGMTLYTYSSDTDVPGKSTCYSQCATNWPPYLVGPEDNVSNVKAGIEGRVGTIIRTDGSIQVTYNRQPLYFYIKDQQQGDVKGHGVGEVWFVIKP